MSGSATANSAISGLLSQPMPLRSSKIPIRKNSSLTMPKLSISKKRHSRPATTGAIINGYRNPVRSHRDRLPRLLNSSAAASPSTNSRVTTSTV